MIHSPLGHAGEGERERQQGVIIVQRLHGLLRALRLYDAANQTVQAQLRELESAFAQLGGDEALLMGLGEYLYLNNVRLRPSSTQATLFRALLMEFAQRGLAGLRVRAGAPASELEVVAALLLRHRDADGGATLAREIAARGLRHVSTVLAHELAGQDAGDANDNNATEPLDSRQRARRLYHAAVAGTEQVVARSAAQGRPALQQARRVVQPLVDQVMKSEYSILGMTAIREHDEHTYAHCVNVSVLSIRIGQVLGMSRQELANLGVAALLHDVGKVMVPTEVLQKAGKLEPAEWDAIRRHPLEGFKLVCRMPHLTQLTLTTARVALQHHVSLDGTGYPASVNATRVSTAARIVAVADFFDAVTAHRAYRKRPLTPFEALHLILRVERAKFDPAPVWALLQAVGHYPAGTVLQMRSGFVLLSLSPSAEDPRRPMCRVLVRPDGSLPPEDAPEFWDPMPAT
ncbi:MAG: HD domain-containing phosphohydrolase, partial [Candidatus Eisenbacteria bacterium]